MNINPTEIDLDDVVARLECGETLTAIAETMDVPRSTLMRKIDQMGGSARVVSARLVAAAAYAEKAEKVISSAESPFDLAKAKELAHHYRWQASKANPGAFGDKVQVEADINATVTKIVREFI